MTPNAVALFNIAVGLSLPTILGSYMGWRLHRRSDLPRWFGLVAFVAMPAALLLCQPFMLASTHAWSARRIDGALAAIDHAMGDPSIVLGQHAYGHHVRMLLLWVWYSSLPTGISIAIATAERPMMALLAYFVLAMIADPLYDLTPALGPAQSLQVFPWQGLSWQAAPHGDCNAFPSLHTAGSLIALLCAPRRLAWRWGIYSAGIVTACLATGQHWAIDCMAGAVLALVVVKTVEATMGWIATSPRAAVQGAMDPEV